MCDIVNYIKKRSSIAEIVVKGCKLWSNTNYNKTQLEDDEMPFSDSTALTVRNFDALQKDIAALKNIRDQVEETVQNINDAECVCTTCGKTGLLYRDEFEKCSICGSYVCQDCAISTIDGQTMCESCYNDDY